MSRLKPVVAASFIVMVAGCGGGDAPKFNPVPVQPAPPKPASPWEPNPARAAQLTAVGKIGKYQFQLPGGYASTPLPDQPPAGITSIAWRAKNTPPGRDEGITATIATGPAAVAEAKNVEQILRELTSAAAAAAATDRPKLLYSRGQTETGTMAGLEFSRAMWSTGKSFSGQPEGAMGYAYTAIDGDTAEFIITFGWDFGTAKVHEAAVATFTKP